MLGGADNPNGELPSYITGANTPATFAAVHSDTTRNTTLNGPGLNTLTKG